MLANTVRLSSHPSAVAGVYHMLPVLPNVSIGLREVLPDSNHDQVSRGPSIQPAGSVLAVGVTSPSGSGVFTAPPRMMQPGDLTGITSNHRLKRPRPILPSGQFSGHKRPASLGNDVARVSPYLPESAFSRPTKKQRRDALTMLANVALRDATEEPVVGSGGV